MLRRAILAAAHSLRIQRFAGRHGMRLGAARFVGGETLNEIVVTLRRLNERGLRTNTTLLGEAVADREAAERVVAAYEDVLQRVADERLQTNVALLFAPPRAVARAGRVHRRRDARRAADRARGRARGAGGDRPSRFELQMLYGVRPQLQLDLVRRGYAVLVATPYGPDWYPYLMRRLAERPANLLFFLRSAVRR